MLHLGALIDTARGLVFPSPARTETIIHATRALLGLTQVSALRLRQVTGLLASCHALVPLCMFRLRPLSILLRNNFDMRVDRTSKLIPLSSPVIQSTLEFWSRRDLVSQGVPLQPLPPSHVLTMDASTYGWGAVCGPLTARRVWLSDQYSLHINFLELETVFLALKTFQKWLCGTRPSSDGQYNGDAPSEQGGRDQVQELGLESQGDYSLVSEHEDYIVSSTYLGTRQCGGGSPISILDRESSPFGVLHRMVSRPQGDQPTLRYLGPTYSRLVCHTAEQQGQGVLFLPPRPSSSAGQFPASRLVQGSTVYVSPVPLLSLVLHKVIREEAQVIAILPWWPRRGWFPLVLQLLVDLPVMLPERDGLLLAPDGTEFPDLGELRLAAWRLLGDLSAAEAFREKLLPPCVQLIDR